MKRIFRRARQGLPYLIDYVRTEFDTPVVANGQSLDHEDAVMMRFQVDF